METLKKPSSSVYLYVTSLLILLACLGIGLAIALRKPLWGDEVLSLNLIIHSSYPVLLSHPIPEGNVCHFFYILQRLIFDVSGFTLPPQWEAGQWDFVYPYGWVIVRLNPVFFMSLSIVLIYYYFSRFYSKSAGWFSVFISLSSYMVWGYWAEARPYAVWFFLITAQLLLFLRVVDSRNFSRLTWIVLVIVHLFLSFTSILSVALIGIVSLLLWIYVDKDWRKYILLTVLPSSICLLYYLYSPKWQWRFESSPMELIGASISKDRFMIIFIFAVALFFNFWQKKIKAGRIFSDDSTRVGVPYLILTLLMILSAFAIIFMLKLGATTSREGFEIPGRYFIYLTPVGIIAIMLFSVQLWRAFQGRPRMLIIGTLAIGGLVLFRALRTFALAKGFYFFSANNSF